MERRKRGGMKRPVTVLREGQWFSMELVKRRLCVVSSYRVEVARSEVS